MSHRRNSIVPDISLIVPVVERHGDLKRLYGEFAAEFDALGKRAEFVFVVDRRQENTLPDLRELQQEATHEITLIILGGSFGEAAALALGLEQARAEIILTSAAYLQVDPKGLGGALRRLEKGADLVIARRYPRTDSLVNRMQSRIFHWVVGLMTGSRFGDISCGLRVMKRSFARNLTIYGGLHRFIPILALRHGYVVSEIELPQRPEDTETRYYGLAVYAKRLLDVLTVFFLVKFTYRPLRFFGVLGLILSGFGIFITGYLGIYGLLGFGAIADRPILLFGVLLSVLGIQILSLGLIGEIIIFTHTRQIEHYRVSEIIHQNRELGSAPGNLPESHDAARGPAV